VSVACIPSSPADLELIAQLKSKLQYAEMRIRVLEASAADADREVLSVRRKARPWQNGIVRTRACRQRNDRAAGERARARVSLDQEIRQASGAPGVAGESSSRGADSALRVRSERMQTLRQRNRGDRLRGEFPTGRRTREVLRAGHETREAGLPVV